MKTIITLLFFAMVADPCTAQPGSFLVRHDTLRLGPGDKGWEVPVSGGAGTEALPVFLLRSVASGLQQAYDPITDERIPAGSIYSWRQPVDTVMVWDEQKQVSSLKVVQNTLKPENISSIRIYLDWRLDLETGKLKAETQSLVVFRNIYSGSGMLIGQGPFCRIPQSP